MKKIIFIICLLLTGNLFAQAPKRAVGLGQSGFDLSKDHTFTGAVTFDGAVVFNATVTINLGSNEIFRVAYSDDDTTAAGNDGSDAFAFNVILDGVTNTSIDTTGKMSLEAPIKITAQDYTITITGVTFNSNLISNSESIVDLTSVWQSNTDNAIVSGNMIFARSKGTEAAPTAVVDGNELGMIIFCGFDGTDYEFSSAIEAVVDETTVASNEMGGALKFSTTAEGTNTLVERIRIDEAGNVGIGTAAPKAQLAGHSATPIWYLTDTDINLNVSSLTEATDSATVKIDISGEPSISLEATDGDNATIQIATGDELRFSGNRLTTSKIRFSNSSWVQKANGIISAIQGTNGFQIAAEASVPMALVSGSGSAIYIEDNSGNATVTISNDNRNLTIDGNKTTSNLLQIVNDDDGAVGDSTAFIDKLGGISASGASTISGAFNFLADTSSTNDTYGGTISPALLAWNTGTIVSMTVGVNNTGACTVAPNGLTAKSVKTASGADPANSDLVTTSVSLLVYDGTNLLLINPATTTD